VDLGPGDVIVIPSNVPHEALCIGDVEEMDTWSPRRDDWLNKTDDYLRSP
jgi:quercetin dioxygenase-like cupin family protein